MTEGTDTSEQSDPTVVTNGHELSDISEQPPGTESADLPSSDQSGIVPSDERPDESTEARRTVQGPSIRKPDPELKPTISYKIDYFNIETGESVFIEEASEPIQVQLNRASKETTVLEVITEVRTLWKSKVESANSGEFQPPPGQDVSVTYLQINSLAIVDALQNVVEYYPGLRFLGDSVMIDEPYRVLVHHEKGLKEIRQSFAPGAQLSEEQKCLRKAKTFEHLGVLEDFIQHSIGSSVKAERQRHAKGYCTFEMLWLLLKPGTDVYHDRDADGNYDGYVVHSVTGGVLNRRKRPLEVVLWYLKFDGRSVNRVTINVTLTPFDGEQKISKYVLIPCEHWSEREGTSESKPLRKRLEERGEMYYRLTARQCMSYNGDTATTPRKHVSCLYCGRHRALIFSLSV